MTAVPTITPSIRMTEVAGNGDPAAPRPRSAEIAVDITAGATALSQRISTDCDTAAAAQAVLAAHLTGLAVAFGALADEPAAIRRVELVGGLESWTRTVTLVIRPAGRQNQIALLSRLAETQPFIRLGCESCDVLAAPEPSEIEDIR